MTEQELTSIGGEIGRLYEEQLQQNEIVSKSWLITTFVNEHKHVDCEDAPVANFCISFTAARCVERLISQKMKEERNHDPGQESLPDMENSLREAYLVERDGDIKAVPIHLCSNEELRGKVAELRSHAAGTMRHADVLDRYIEQREQWDLSSAG